MALEIRKWKTTNEDFETRKEKAIQILIGVEFVSTPRTRFKFTEKQLREDFAFDDVDKKYDKYDNFYFDGNFVIYPIEKIILV